MWQDPGAIQWTASSRFCKRVFAFECNIILFIPRATDSDFWTQVTNAYFELNNGLELERCN